MNNYSETTRNNQNATSESIYHVTGNYETDLNNVKDYFNYGISADIKIREIKISGQKAFILFIEGMVNTSIIDENILMPLMLLSTDAPSKEELLDTLITHNQAVCEAMFDNIAQSVNFGDCAIFVNNVKTGIVCDVKTWDRRGIDTPITDTVIIGPHEGFNENFKINTALVRKIIRDQNLIIENLTVGNKSKTPCALMYMKNITNNTFVENLRDRITNIDIDYIYQVSELEQLIEDSTFSLVPQMIKTERPDRTAEALIEGKPAILLQGSPFALILPVTLTEFITTTEDKYLRFPYSNMMRAIRYLGVFVSLFISSLYLALVNFHHEMIPTELLFAIEVTREAIPFSTITELLVMELSFDLIREASIRVPSPIGSTIGIVGGLIIGQSAVTANIVSPITIIIVALAGIGSFAIPDYSASLAIRLSRYLFILLSSLGGFIGISYGMFICVCLLAKTQSLGISLLQPLTNDNTNLFRFIFSYPIWKKEHRHNYLKAKYNRIQAIISRKWAK